jgi:hypothetical protein
MKKQVLLSIAVLVLLVAAVMPVAAEGGKNKIRWLGSVFALVGEVTAVDAEAETITVNVHTGNSLIKQYIGRELTLATGADTLFLRFGEECEQITFADVELGAYISANGQVVNDLFVAKRVTVGVPLHYQQ